MTIDEMQELMKQQSSDMKKTIQSLDMSIESLMVGLMSLEECNDDNI